MHLGDEVRELVLDGVWQAGLDRVYDQEVRVPGLATSPDRATAGVLWYRRMVDIPPGRWTRATLTLRGARFAPRVLVDGEPVSSAEGGMAATSHRFLLPSQGADGGGSFVLEIALSSLTDLDPLDASAVPWADRWRNNVSSCLWDSVLLRLHGDGEIVRVTPTGDLAGDVVRVDLDVEAPPPAGALVVLSLIDDAGRLVASQVVPIAGEIHGTAVLELSGRIARWSPGQPTCYLLRTMLMQDGRILDAVEQTFGLREFVIDGLGFRLNGIPCPVRMGTVVWHRWTRDPEAREIAFDPAWFERNIVVRLKQMGANALRFHLGLPPEALLDLCDRHGLLVQLEWPFFHGVAASEASMRVQYRAWLDTAMRHPSVVILHPWNETGGEQLVPAHRALESVLATCPPLVVCHRDLTPVHKYWWSLFENVGLYYDSAAQFRQAVMADEFGGNYLDGNADPGDYPTTREAFLRFLGRNHTAAERLELHSDANARIAEYWRRLGVAGFSPFTILGSPQDGNHWFLGRTDVATPTPKPVWAALAAAFAPRSLSLELWNRNFTPGEVIRTPLWFFNDGDREQACSAQVRVLVRRENAGTDIDAVPPQRIAITLAAHSTRTVTIAITLPDRPGSWRIEARLLKPDAPSPLPVVSAWRVRTVTPQPSSRLMETVIGVPTEETALREALTRFGLRLVDAEDPTAALIVGSATTWQRLQDPAVRTEFERRVFQGTGMVLLDAGPQPLGVGYLTGDQLGGPLEAAPSLDSPALLQETVLFGGVRVAFREAAEPESAIHPPADETPGWQHIPHGATQLWNGLRGGLIVPAADMEVSGLSGPALLAVWQARGADPSHITAGRCVAYELAGSYAFAEGTDDQAVTDRLRQQVRQLVEDAPALASVINPDAAITVTDLGALHRSAAGKAEGLTPLALAGKNLCRTPVVELTFGAGAGTVVVSQLLTRGRLVPAQAEPGPGVYGLRHDPVAVQMVLNLLDRALGCADR